MFTRKNLKLAVLFAVLPTAGYFLAAQISRAQQTGGAGVPTTGNPQVIDRQIRRDLRKNPPQVDEFNGTLLTGAATAGNVLLTIRFAKEEEIPPTIEINLGDRVVKFHDDGRDGDKAAQDGIHSAITSIDRTELEKDQRRIANIKSDAVPVFRGREFITLNKINRQADLLRFRPGFPISLLPVGDPANIDSPRSLMINAPSVVQDPGRTRTACGTGSTGKWSFAYLMTQMANQPLTGITPEAFVLRWLKRWRNTQTVNDFPVPARAAGVNALISNWPKNADGSLNLSMAPLRLLAIVNRADLRGSFSYGGGGAGNGGELRFVFAVLDPVSCAPQRFTVIFEYGVKKNTCAEMKNWGQQWKNLDSMAIGSAAYRNALEAITEQIVIANADPAKPNGSALNQLRTNELSLGSPWELREFQVSSATGGHLEEVTVKQNPDVSFDTTADLGNFINMNEAAVLMDRHTVPLTIGAAADPFLGGAAPVPLNNNNFRWSSATISNPEARFHFSLQTCNSCHAGETQTSLFTHVEVAGFGGGTAGLSRFLRGSTVDPNDFPDPFPVAFGPLSHNFNDLVRRKADLDALINTPCFKQFAIKPIAMVH